jgi:two-component system, OmpR family, sensor kinase
MSIRLRLALWYGSLTGFALLLSALFSFAFHSRGHYDDLDRALVTTADHASAELDTSTENAHLTAQLSGLDMALRLYDADGRLLEGPIGISLPAPVNPQNVLEHPAGPAFDTISGIVPAMPGALVKPEIGAFATIEHDGQRWRAFILPVLESEQVIAYIEATSPLGRLDTSMRAFRSLMMGLAGVSLILVFIVSWATASGALRPVAQMIQTAQSISRSRDISRRIEAPTQPDELGQLAEAFNNMLASLEEAYRAQQRFVSDASHELRAPLTGIQGNLDLLERHPDMPPEDRQEALQEASREAHRLTRLVADLLALARADAGTSLPRQRVELDQVVMEAINDARHLAQDQRIEIAKLEPVVLSGNADRLKQLLLILLDNAIKYTPTGGRITLGLTHREAHIVLTVQDSGVGIPEDALPHIFERFFRADPARSRDPGGTGLGLPIAQWIVEQHGGTIQAQSEIGIGTTITVRLNAM